jgi:hypothetical protein
MPILHFFVPYGVIILLQKVKRGLNKVSLSQKKIPPKEMRLTSDFVKSYFH